MFWFVVLTLLCLLGGNFIALGCSKGQRRCLHRKPTSEKKNVSKDSLKASSTRNTCDQSVSSKSLASNLDNSFLARLKKSYEIMTNKSSKLKRSEQSLKLFEKSSKLKMSQRLDHDDSKKSKLNDVVSRSRLFTSSRKSIHSDNHRSKRDKKPLFVDRLQSLKPEDLPPDPPRPPGEAFLLTDLRSTKLLQPIQSTSAPARPFLNPVPPGPPISTPINARSCIHCMSYSMPQSHISTPNDFRVTRSSILSSGSRIDHYNIPTKPKPNNFQPITLPPVSSLQPPGPPIASKVPLRLNPPSKPRNSNFVKKEAPSPWAIVLTKKGYAKLNSHDGKHKSKGSKSLKGSKTSKEGKRKKKKKKKGSRHSKSKSKESFTDKLFKASPKRISASSSNKMSKKPAENEY